MNQNHIPLFRISDAADLAGMHPQTLREYDRLGIVSPARTPGRGRRYSLDDIDQLRMVQRLSQEEGINLSGIKRIIWLERQLAAALTEVERLRFIAEPGHHRVFSADRTGSVVVTRAGHRVSISENRAELILWRPSPRG